MTFCAGSLFQQWKFRRSREESSCAYRQKEDQALVIQPLPAKARLSPGLEFGPIRVETHRFLVARSLHAERCPSAFEPWVAFIRVGIQIERFL